MVGERPQVREVRAVQFPEQNFIRDMVLNFADMAYEISSAEYESVKARAMRDI